MAIESPEETRRRREREAAERKRKQEEREAKIKARVQQEQQRLNHLGVQVWWLDDVAPHVSLTCPYCGESQAVSSDQIRDDGSTDARCRPGALKKICYGERGPYELFTAAGETAPLDRDKFEREVAKREGALVQRNAAAQRRVLGAKLQAGGLVLLFIVLVALYYATGPRP